MAIVTVKLRGIPETEAAIGWAGGHSVVVDRPEGKAGGQGLGFSGGQLLALAIGGCFCNILHFVAFEMGVRLASVSVDAAVTFEGDPPLATSAAIRATVEGADGDADLDALLKRAEERCPVSNSVFRGFPVSVVPDRPAAGRGRKAHT